MEQISSIWFSSSWLNSVRKDLNPLIDYETASMAKLYTTEAAVRNSSKLLQLFGGWGYMWEYPVAKTFAGTRVMVSRFLMKVESCPNNISIKGLKGDKFRINQEPISDFISKPTLQNWHLLSDNLCWNIGDYAWTYLSRHLPKVRLTLWRITLSRSHDFRQIKSISTLFLPFPFFSLLQNLLISRCHSYFLPIDFILCQKFLVDFLNTKSTPSNQNLETFTGSTPSM